MQSREITLLAIGSSLLQLILAKFSKKHTNSRWPMWTEWLLSGLLVGYYLILINRPSLQSYFQSLQSFIFYRIAALVILAQVIIGRENPGESVFVFFYHVMQVCLQQILPISVGSIIALNLQNFTSMER